MKKSDIYEIAIKILGLYLIIVLIGQLKEILISLAVLNQIWQDPGHTDGNYPILIFWTMLLCFVLLGCFAYYLIFKSAKITRLICKPGDYENPVNFTANKTVIYEISLILLGLVTIVLTLPDFAFRLKGYISLIQNDIPTQKTDTAFLITSALKIIIALLAITNERGLARYFGREKVNSSNKDQE